MRSPGCLLGISLAVLPIPGAGVAPAAEPARSVGPGYGVLAVPERDNPCGYLRLTADDEYEYGYAWDYWYNEDPPY